MDMSKEKSISNLILKAFSAITTQRSALMGLAMLAVFLTHAPSLKLGYVPTGIIGIICHYGYWGVDVFIFLSAFGLCYSLQKNNLNLYYKNRLKRILPTWLLVLIGVHIIGLLLSSRFPDMDFNYPKNFVECISWYSGLGYFFGTCHYEWYVPSLLLLYCISPLLFRSTRRIIYFLIISSIIFCAINNYCNLFPHIKSLIDRLPVFCIGFIFYKEYNGGNIIRFLVILVFLFIFTFILVKANLISTTIIFGCMVPIILMIISLLFSKMNLIPWVLNILGSISLEYYLIHLYRRPQFLMSLWIDNSNLQVVLSFILCFVCAYFLHHLISYIKNV